MDKNTKTFERTAAHVFLRDLLRQEGVTIEGGTDSLLPQTFPDFQLSMPKECGADFERVMVMELTQLEIASAEPLLYNFPVAVFIHSIQARFRLDPHADLFVLLRDRSKADKEVVSVWKLFPVEKTAVFYTQNGTVTWCTGNWNEGKKASTLKLQSTATAISRKFENHTLMVSLGLREGDDCVVVNDMQGPEGVYDNFRDMFPQLQIGGVIAFGGGKLVIGATHQDDCSEDYQELGSRLVIYRPRKPSSGDDFKRDVQNNAFLRGSLRSKAHVLAMVSKAVLGHVFAVSPRMDGTLRLSATSSKTAGMH